MIIGITGGVGCGKSTVLNYLSTKYGAEVYRLDEVAKRLQEKGGPLYNGMRELYGDDCLLEDGSLNRRAIAKKMYAVPGLEEQTNDLVHPAVMEEVEEIVASFNERHFGNAEGEEEEEIAEDDDVPLPKPLLVIEAALLIEAGYAYICDEMWYIYARESVRRDRLKVSRGYDDRLIDGIEAKQLSENVFREHCHFVIDNSDSFEETKKQIDERLGQ
ncbi:MAG: dephospho-CoA kinase [Lachnospiraceae bacterium]|nr:dephospho-CoA kinase [Candidatus Equihabitans merdae]